MDSARRCLLDGRGVTPLLFAYLAPGYSMIFDLSTDDRHAAGLALAVAGGASVDLERRFFASGEVGYRLGAQEIAQQSHDLAHRTRYLHLGLSLGARF